MADYSLGKAEGEIVLTYRGDAVDRAKRDVDSLSKGQGSASAAFDKTGRAAGIAGLAIAGGFALAVNSAASFEERMSAISAVSGATEADMEKVRSKALQLGKDTKFSATEAALAMEELSKAGLTIPDIMNGAADATVALAAAGEVELPRAAEIASNAMNMFGLSAREMPHVADLLAGAANASAVSVDELAMAMTQAGAVANTVGLSIDDTTAAIGLLGNAGIKGSDAGTSLKSMLLNLQPTTKKQIDLFKELGLVTEDGSNKFFDAQGNIKSMAGISGTLEKALQGMTKQQKLATLETLFGTDAIRAASVFADQGSKGFNKFADAMGKVSAADVAAKRMDNLKGDLEELKGSLETAAIAVGTIVLPALRSLADSLTGVANWFLNLSDTQQKWFVAIIAAIGGILLLVSAIIKITLAIRSAIIALRAIQAAMATTWVAALGPIALVIAAVAAIGIALFLLWKKSETFRDIVKAVWEAVKTAALAVANWFTGPFVGFFTDLWSKIRSIWNSITSTVTSAINAVRSVVSSVINTIKSIWTSVWNTFGPVVRAVWNLIKAIITLALTIILGVLKAQFAVVKAVVTTAWDGVKAVTSAVWRAIENVVQGAVRAVKAVIDNVLSPIVSLVRGIFNNVIGAIRGPLTTAYNTVTRIVGNIRDFFSGAASWLVQAGRDIIQGLINGITGMAATLLNKVTDLVNKATSAVKSAFKIGSPSKVMAEIGKDVGAGLAVGIAQSASDIKDAASSMASNARDAIKDQLEKKNIAPDAATGLKTFLTNQITDLNEFAKKRDVVIAKLQTAKEKLKTALDTRDAFAAQITGQAIGFGAITGLTEPGAEGQEVVPSAAGLISGLAERRQAIVNYKNQLAHLAASGLNSTTYEQLLAAGVEAGSGYANSIMEGGQAAIGTINAIQSDINATSKAMGTSSAAQLHQAGVDSAQGLIDGLKSKRDELTKILEDIAKRIVRTIRKTLKIKSPSRVMIEQASEMMRGLIVGIDGAAGDVYSAMRSAVKPLPNALEGLTGPGVRSASLAAAAGTPSSTTTTYGGDTVTIQAQTNADPEEIVDEYIWQKRTRLLGVRR